MRIHPFLRPYLHALEAVLAIFAIYFVVSSLLHEYERLMSHFLSMTFVDKCLAMSSTLFIMILHSLRLPRYVLLVTTGLVVSALIIRRGVIWIHKRSRHWDNIL